MGNLRCYSVVKLQRRECTGKLFAFRSLSAQNRDTLRGGRAEQHRHEIRFCAWQRCSSDQPTERRSFCSIIAIKFISNLEWLFMELYSIEDVICTSHSTSKKNIDKFNFLFRMLQKGLVRICCWRFYAIHSFEECSMYSVKMFYTLTSEWHNTNCVTSWLWTCRRASHQFSSSYFFFSYEFFLFRNFPFLHIFVVLRMTYEIYDAHFCCHFRKFAAFQN